MDLLPRREFLLTLPRRRVAAGALIRNEQGQICLVMPTYRPDALLPGGMVETGESPPEGVAREIVEELGVSLQVGRLLALEHVPTDDDDEHGAMVLVYDGGVVTASQIAEFVHLDGEIESVVFADVGELTRLCSPGGAARIRAAYEALQDGSVAELRR